MTNNINSEVQQKFAIAQDEVKTSAWFVAICCFAFISSIATTIYFYYSMCCDMDMPGGWTMSMMWMRMPGETLLSSSLSFIFMWIAMMITMMIPSALPMFLKTGKQWNFLCYTALGYFTIWMLAGVLVYIPGVLFANAAMQSVSLSHAFPLLSGIVLILAGAYQFTSLKMTNLLHCRSAFGCAISTFQHQRSFQLGCKQGVVCCACCLGLMTVQLVLGVMNSFAMIAVAIAITAEKLLPRPEITVRVIGVIAIITGIANIISWY